MNYPKVSIIILNWNGLDYTIRCLQSLKKTTYPNYEIILVDNGSDKNEADILEKKYQGYIRVIRNKENLGFSGGNNVAMREIMKKGESKYVLLLNNDTKIIQKDWLDKLIKIGESEENIGIIGCTPLLPSGKFQAGGTILKDPLHYTDISDKVENFTEVDLVKGVCFMIKKKVIDKIGLLDENFYLAQGEDCDYCMRAKKAGFKVIYAPQVRIFHYGRAAIKNLRNLDYIVARNAMRFVLLNYPITWIIPWFIYHFGVCIFRKKDRNQKISLGNLTFKKDWKKKLHIFLKAIGYNLKEIKDIVYKRMNRTKKIE